MSTNDKIEFRKQVLIATNSSLIGNVSSEMRMISLKWNYEKMDIRVIFSKEPSEDDRDLVSEIMGELLAHFPSINSCDENCLYSDLPFSEIEPFGEVVFMRKE